MRRSLVIAATFVIALVLFHAISNDSSVSAPKGTLPTLTSSQADDSRIVRQMNLAPLTFTENQGQWDESVLFRANAGRASMWFTRDGVYHQFTRRVSAPTEDPAAELWGTQDELGNDEKNCEQLVITSSLIGAKASPNAFGTELMEYKCNYFLGNDPDNWRTDVPNYRAIVLEEVYAGVDLKYYSNESGKLEYDFIVEPGADPSVIQVHYDGANSLSVNDAGELVIETDWHSFTQLAPKVYQIQDGDQIDIGGDYVLMPNNTFAFELGADYDPTLALVIDPVLVFSTYLGGSAGEDVYAIAVDQYAQAVVAGYTYSSDFPLQSALYGTHMGGQTDAYVTKFSEDGTSLVFSTYFGGTGGDYAKALTLDVYGDIYFGGFTSSADLPIVNAYQASLVGGGGFNTDAFLSKISSSGNSITYSTYLGGSDQEEIRDICTDTSALPSAYLVGFTNSTDFPTYNAYDATLGGTRDNFVTKMSWDGSSVIYSTYLGGSSDEGALCGIDVDVWGQAYVTGSTESSNFPTYYAYDNSYNGAWDAFVTKFKLTGDALWYSTFVGGSDKDIGCDIVVEEENVAGAWIVGYSWSADYPTLNAYDDTHNNPGGNDAIVTAVEYNGLSLRYSTFLGGTGSDSPTSIGFGEDGTVTIGGTTSSADFPLLEPVDDVFYCQEAFACVLSQDLDSLFFSTFLGGPSCTQFRCMDVLSSGSIYLGGQTTSPEFPVVSAYQDYLNGYNDGFVACIEDIPGPSPSHVYIDSVFPGQNAVGVPHDTDIHVYFSEDMDTSSFNFENDGLSVVGSWNGYKHAGYSYDDLSRKLTISHGLFDAGELVTVSIKGDAQSTGGLSLEHRFSWQFYIESMDGSGMFTPIYIDTLIGYAPIAACVADFDCNGADEFAIAGGGVNYIIVYHQNGVGAVPPYSITSINYGLAAPEHLMAAQTIDQYPDIYAISNVDYKFGLYRNDGAGNFYDATSYSIMSKGVYIAHCPFKDTSVCRFAIAAYDLDWISYHTFDRADGSSWESLPSSAHGPSSLAWADFNNDGSLEVASSDLLSDSVSIYWFGETSHHFVGSGSMPIDLVAADFNGDNYCDIAAALYNRSDVGILINSGHGYFEPVELIPLPLGYPNSIVTFDYNADGNLDLLVGHELDTDLTKLSGNGDGTFSVAGATTSYTRPYDMVICDFNDDHVVDLVIPSYAYDEVVVLYGIQTDEDFDGIPAAEDNCPTDYNPGQEDADNDGEGDVCDLCTDTDDDGYGNPGYPENSCPLDNCPTIANASQNDTDGDGVGDACTFESLMTIGTGVGTDFGYASILFDEITTEGTVELEITSTGPEPSGFTIEPSVPPVYYDFSTTADYTGNVTVCINYDDTGMSPEDEAGLAMMHHNGSIWIDITSSLDTESNLLCGTTTSLSPFAVGIPSYVCGDADGSDEVDIDDVVYLISFIFSGGPAPEPYESGDANCSGGVDIDDVVWLIAYIFSGGNAPCDTSGDSSPDC